MKIAVIGAGSWGTALANLLAHNGHNVSLWARRSEVATSINKDHRNPRYLTDVELHSDVVATLSHRDAVLRARAAVIVTPSNLLRGVARALADAVDQDFPVIICSKGVEEGSGMLPIEVFASEMGNPDRFAVLSGPNHAEEVVRGIPSGTVIASPSRDTAEFFRRSFEDAGALQRVVMFLNLASDPIIERILTPRCALTAAEYLAFQHGYHVLVIMTDMTSYCEALREFSSSKGEIPSRKGFPAYLYSDLASLYERAGMIQGKSGSVTQVPILTMPNDDITHPIPDLTGYITEGQIVLDRDMDQKGVYPPVNILSSLSRLMKDGIGEGFTRADHPALSNQLFASYSKVQDARSLASVIGEDELSETDKQYLAFGRAFEEHFVSQSLLEDRTMEQTLDIGWKLLTLLPKSELDRIDANTIEAHYVEDAWKTLAPTVKS